MYKNVDKEGFVALQVVALRRMIFSCCYSFC